MHEISVESLVTECFGPQGWLVTTHGFTHEPAQIAYALGVAQWLTGEEAQPLGYIEGGTGVGKSLGYLVPLLCHVLMSGQRGCVATHTLYLQDQLLDPDGGDLTIAEEFVAFAGLGRPKVAQLVGRHQYLDPLRFELLLQQLIEDGQTITNYKDFVAGAYACAEQDGRIETFLADYGPLPAGIDIHRCHLTQESDISSGYLQSREKAKAADLVITSHTMLLLNRGFGKQRIFECDKHPIEHVVIDEADLLPQAAESLSSMKLRPSNIKRTFGLLKSLSSKAGKDAIDSLGRHCDELQTRLDQYAATKHEPRPIVFSGRGESFEKAIIDASNHAAHAIGTVLRAVQKKRNLTHENQILLDNALAVAQFFERFCGDRRTSAIGVSWSPFLKLSSLEVSRPFPGEIIKSYFLNKNDHKTRILFTSATLSNGSKGGFENFKGELRVYGSNLSAVESIHEPSDFGSCRYILAPAKTALPIARDKEDGAQLSVSWLNVAAEMVKMAASSGPTLCLTVSHFEATSIAKRIKSSDIQVLLHEPGIKLSELLTSLEAGGGVVISPSCWQGVSPRTQDGGQLFQNLVISRMPFSPPDPFWEQAVRHTFDGKGISRQKANAIIWGMSTIEVVRKLRQGFGRLIRKRDDVGSIWICDPRFKPASQIHSNRQAHSLANAIPSRFWESYLASEQFDPDSGETIPVTKFEMPKEISTWL